MNIKDMDNEQLLSRFAAKVRENIQHVDKGMQNGAALEAMVFHAEILSRMRMNGGVGNVRMDLLYPETALFAAAMSDQLAGNADDKGDWHEWHPHWTVSLGEAKYHMEKLQSAFESDDKDRVLEYAADVGNILMKLCQEAGVLPQPPKEG